MSVQKAFQAAFWERVELPEGCWEWRGSRHPAGYGQFTMHGQSRRIAHRLAYEMFVGPIPEGWDVCHHCDNPSCVRPDHLFVGTRTMNMQDAVAKGRIASGIRSARAKLTEDQVREIRDLVKRPDRPTDKAIAARFGIGHVSVWRIRHGTHWRTLTDT